MFVYQLSSRVLRNIEEPEYYADLEKAKLRSQKDFDFLRKLNNGFSKNLTWIGDDVKQTAVEIIGEDAGKCQVVYEIERILVIE
jgi:hypothetical protein